MKTVHRFILPLVLAAGLPAKALACATCYGQSDSPMAQGMNWGILTLLGVVGTVLTCFLVFFVHIIRKSEAVAEQSEKAAAEPSEKKD